MDKEKKVLENKSQDQVQENFDNNFTPGVHKWGRFSMVLALILSFLPILYMYFILGWKADVSAYLGIIIAIGSFGIGMWLTEPISYFPILGSAGTYMSYLAGNVGNMRAPVSLSVQSALDTDVTTPRGNIATIIAIAASVYVNLAILVFIIIVGQGLLSIMPQMIIDSFAYIIPSLFGCVIVMRFRKNVKMAIQYAIPATIVYLIVRQIPQVMTFRLAIVIGSTVLYAYIKNKMENKSQTDNN